ncbi:MAG: glycosyltransferase family 4 protein [Thermoleophilia bacterium]
MNQQKKVLVLQAWGGERGERLVDSCADQLGYTCEFIREPLPTFAYSNVFGKIATWYWPSTKAALKALRRRSEPDVILCSDPMCGLVMVFLARLFHLKLPPVVISMFLFRNWKPAFMDKLRHSFANYGLMRVQKIICFSSFEVDRYRREFPRHADKFFFVNVGNDPTVLDLDKELQRVLTNPPTPYVFSGGATNRDYKTLVDAMATMQEVKIKIIARKQNFPGVTPNLEFMHDVYGADFERSIFDAQVIVLPLFDHCFSSGQLTLLKAMELGKAIVASDVPGVRDYLTNEHNGLLVPAEDAGAMTTAIKKLLDDETERVRIGNNAQMTFSSKYTQEQSISDIFSCVDEVVRGAM